MLQLCTEWRYNSMLSFPLSSPTVFIISNLSQFLTYFISGKVWLVYSYSSIPEHMHVCMYVFFLLFALGETFFLYLLNCKNKWVVMIVIITISNMSTYIDMSDH